MSLIKSMRRQKAIWWKRSDTKDRYGRYTFADPVEIKCRWEDVNDEVKDSKGDVLVSKSKVYVDRAMKEGDILKRGPLQSDTHPDPRQETDAFEIQVMENLPNFKATEFLITARL